MISRTSLFRISIVSSVAIATIISGCRLPRAKCHRCACHQVAHQDRSVVVVDASPYNLPQNAGCFEQSPATTSVISEPPMIQQHTPIDAKEIESIPEVAPQEVVEPVSPDASSRISQPDESTSETIAQLQPPVAEAPNDFEAFPEPPQVAHEELKPTTVPEPAPIEKPVVDESLADENPYYLVKEQAPATAPAKLQTPPQREPGAVFDELANEIFSDIDLREKLELRPIHVPSQPASFAPPTSNRSSNDEEEAAPESSSTTTESEEVFGAIQFDAVLRQAKYGLYAQDVENQEPRVAALESKTAILIRPLPELNQPVPRVASEPYEFQPMPAYHMPTLRAIPQTADREEQPSLVKIRFMDLPAPPKNESIVILNPHATEDAETTEDKGIIALPVDPQPMILPLPKVNETPVNEEFPSTSDRRLTDRNTTPNPLR